MSRCFSLFLVCAAVSLVSGSPVGLVGSNDKSGHPDALEIRTTPKCRTLYSGTLYTRELTKGNDNDEPTNVWKKLSFNSKQEIVYYSDTKKGIAAEFQACTPNYAGGKNNPNNQFPRDTVYWGRIYIPSINKCLAVTNPSSRIGPYYVAAATCLNSADGEMKTAKSIPQNFALRFLHSSDPSRKILVWEGKSKADGTNPQGACENGQFGYEKDDFSQPVTGKDHRVRLLCTMGANVAYGSAELRK